MPQLRSFVDEGVTARLAARAGRALTGRLRAAYCQGYLAGALRADVPNPFEGEEWRPVRRRWWGLWNEGYAHGQEDARAALSAPGRAAS